MMEYPIYYDEMSIESAAVDIAGYARTMKARPTFDIGKFAVCPFCGQLVEMAKDFFKWDLTADEITNYAIWHCICPEATACVRHKEEKERQKRIRDYNLYRAREAIEQQFGGDENEEGPGVSPFPKQVIEELIRAAELVYDDKFSAWSITYQKSKASISKNKKGGLIIDHKDSTTTRAEI